MNQRLEGIEASMKHMEKALETIVSKVWLQLSLPPSSRSIIFSNIEFVDMLNEIKVFHKVM